MSVSARPPLPTEMFAAAVARLGERPFLYSFETPISAVEWPSAQRARSRSIVFAVHSMRFSMAETHHILWATRYGMTTRIGPTSSS